jgi:DNA-binding NarL/FixJ family response regulator
VIRVLLADDQALIRSGIRSLLDAEDDIEVVAEATDGQQAVSLTARHRPDIALMDIQMPAVDGIEATRQIVADERLDSVRVVILTNFGLDEYIFRALRAGASGFLLKDTEPAELLQALRVVMRGDSLLSPSVTRRLIGEFVARPPDAVAATGMEILTNREREAVALVAHGLSNDEIAATMVLSPTTAKTHVSRAMIKLGARDRAQLVVFAYQTGLVSPRDRLDHRGHAVDRAEQPGLLADRRGERRDGRVAAGSLPAGDAGAAAGGHRGEAYAGRRSGHAKLGDQGDSLARRHEGEDGGEVIGMVADARREAAGLAGADHHGVAQGVRAAGDPGGVAPVVDAGLRGAALPGRGRQVEGLLKQRLGVEGGVWFRWHVVVDEGEGDVQGSRVQRTGDGDRVKLGHHQLKAWMVAAERDQGRGQDGACRGGEGADAQRSGQAAAGGGERGRCLFQYREDGLGVAGKDDAGRSERHAPARALEQRHPGLPFQGGELLRHGGRGVRESVGDRGDRSPARELKQQAEPAYVNH